MNLILFSFVLATTTITLAVALSAPAAPIIGESATCTYTCKLDGSCEHKTDFANGGWRRGGCVNPIPPDYCLDGICCKGHTEDCGSCLDKCDGKVGKLVIEAGQVKSNGLRTNTNKQATHSNNPVPQTTQHNSPSSFSNFPLIFLICQKFRQILVPTFSFFLLLLLSGVIFFNFFFPI